ncbi:IS481 family transposase [Arthrobacter sp. I2-34]|uniref:IS481 family transposase n=1 Tax=Arthrobacter hankyongi TaxID=2904801 RepID=A0ABS9LAA8_9MICC|nr:IS481 family transposase [Arthrobacter hankyongi]MCG2623612.1 IS481 family transposase [Arthrobacter hankyongi]
MSHPNSPLSETGRLRLARCIVKDGWPLRRAAERFGVSTATAARWARRYRQHGEAGMAGHSSRPRSCPHQTGRRTERRAVGLRTSRRWGPARIAWHLHLAPSTVRRILARYGCPPLRFTDPASGARIRSGRQVRRYEYPAPGGMLHVDIKKLGSIPDGGGHKVLGRSAGEHNRRSRNRAQTGRRLRGQKLGYGFIHHALDDHSRYACSEILGDETKETAAGFMARALAHFTALGVRVERVMTDNGSCYRSRDFAAVLHDAGVRHYRTRPYRPQTNGKVERFNRILLEEWAYARAYGSETERRSLYPGFLEHYNQHRPHTALKGKAPASRVTNQPA